ncbi:MAG: 5'/3'-nucleotidase SurE [Planctomycetaceae bacterium]
MQILLANDDGIHAPGLRALHAELKQLGNVVVVAPAIEQSGVGHTVTYRSPLQVEEIFDHSQHFGWAVHGSPADCVKLGILEFSPKKPQLVVSGINSGAQLWNQRAVFRDRGCCHRRRVFWRYVRSDFTESG